MMGLRFGERQGKDFYRAHLRPEHIEAIAKIEEKPSLMELTRNWLERMPFFKEEYWSDYVSNHSGDDDDDHPFWTDYKAAYASTLTEMEMDNLNGFDQLLFDDKFNESRRLSPAANRSALFIMTYRDYPILTQPFQLLDTLLEIDELMSTWRTRHISMVHRMIGSRMGTGGSAGAEYLKASRDKHYVFKELGDINSYLIQRKKLPQLSPALEKSLRFGG